jgi:hypothetical protein
MAFEAAVLSRLKVIQETDRFNKECRERIEPLKEERDALSALFINLLTVPGAAPLLQLDDGQYVFLKTASTVRAITEARIRAAIEAITSDQLSRLQGRLIDAVEENLLDECTAINHRPVVSAARPAHVSAQRPPARADAATDRSARRLLEIDARLKTLRRRQTAGREQCRQAVSESDKVFDHWMDTDRLHRRRIEVRPEGVVSSPEPELPDLPSVGESPPTAATSAPPTAPVRITCPDTTEPVLLEVRRPHPRPNRLGRAPTIAVFTAALAKVSVNTPEDLLAAALQLFAALRKPATDARRKGKLTVARM